MYVNGALIIISLTSDNSFCSSSKRLQKKNKQKKTNKQVIAKEKGAPPIPPSPWICLCVGCIFPVISANNQSLLKIAEN